MGVPELGSGYPQLHRLEGFYYVALHLGYARAARAFPYPISQPGVYQQVRKLEEELGVTLFERVAKDRVRMTAPGKHLFDFCSPFFASLPDIVRSLRAGSYAGRLAIDASGLALTQLLPSWVLRLTQLRTDISVDIHEHQNPDFSRLLHGDADLIVDYLPTVPAGVQKRVVAVGDAYVITPSSHPAAKGGRLRLDRLRETPLICYHPSLRQHELQLAAVRQHVGDPIRTISASSVQAICALVQAGLGYSVVPWLGAAGPSAPGLFAKRQAGAGARFEVHAAWYGDPAASPLVSAALDAIAEP